MNENQMDSVNNNPKFGIGLGIIKDEIKNINYNQNYSYDKNITIENKVLELKKLTHSYFQGEQEIKVLDNADLTLYKCEITALVAPSGVGKSTLLHIAGLLCSPLSGQIIINGQDCSKLNDDKLTKLRRDYIGFVYQHHYLLNEFSALENVEMPQINSKSQYL
jgi:lipoprotein-releasing system ATP-binding protein